MLLITKDKHISFVNKDALSHFSVAKGALDSQIRINIDGDERKKSYRKMDEGDLKQALESIKDPASDFSLKDAIEDTKDRELNEQVLRMVNETSKTVYEIKTKYLRLDVDNDEKMAVLKDQTIYEDLVKEKTLDKYQRMLMASISHEIKNPVNAIEAYTAAISESMDLDEIKRIGNNIKFAGRHICYVVSGACDLMFTEKGSPIIEPFSIREAIEEVVDIIQPSINAKPISICVSFPTAIPKHINSDQKRYKLILFHLATNAVKYTKSGAVKISTSFNPDNWMLTTSVVDTGNGMSDEVRKGLFKLYSNVENANEFNPQGMGLGLALCKKLSQLLGGEIKIESQIGEGSTFTFTIKLQPGDNPTGEITSKESDITILPDEDYKRNQIYTQTDESPKPCSCPLALIVDDEATNRFVAKSYLKHFNVTADEAEDGKMAIDKVIARSLGRCCKRYSIILMDLNMPVMDGSTATRKLKGIFAANAAIQAPIIAITAVNLQSNENYAQLLSVGYSEICKSELFI